MNFRRSFDHLVSTCAASRAGQCMPPFVRAKSKGCVARDFSGRLSVPDLTGCPLFVGLWHVPEELIGVGKVRSSGLIGQSLGVLESTRLTLNGHHAEIAKTSK